MTKIPRKSPQKNKKSINGMASKGPYSGPQSNGKKPNSKHNRRKSSVDRRFSIMSKSESESGSDSDSDSNSDSDTPIYPTSNPNVHQHSNSDSDSSDSDSDSDSESDDYQDQFYFKQNHNRKNSVNKFQSSNRTNTNVSSASEDDFSSSSDDENVDFVQLTKQRRMKAMKAVKGLKKQIQNQEEHSISQSPSFSPQPPSTDLIVDDEPELDDDLVDAVIQNEERKMENNLITNSHYNDESLDGGLDEIDFGLSFDDEAIDKTKKSKDTATVVDKLQNEDIGEAVSNMDSTLLPTNNNHTQQNKFDIDVPKFNDKDLNSDDDDDYHFDNNDLIQTLIKDDDAMELRTLNNAAINNQNDDFDYLVANQHKLNHSNISNLSNRSSKDITADDPGLGDAYLMKEESQAMLDDFNTASKQQPLYKARRSSMFFSNNMAEDDLDDLDLDLLNNFEQFLPKQQAMRRRSSILNQTLLSSSDSDSDIAMPNESKKALKKKSKKNKNTMNNFSNSRNNSFTRPRTNSHARNIKKMLGISNSDSNYTSKFASNAIVDSDDDTKLLEYIFEDSESDSTMDKIPKKTKKSRKQIENDNETDEDTNLPKATTQNIGSKHAKEILSSNKDQFRAPKLGTFITKKPFSIIDGVTTRYLCPLEGNDSLMQRAASIKPNDGMSATNNNLMLDDILNISEFDEDYSQDNNDDLDNYFGEKRIPLTAFRNKNNTSINAPIATQRRMSFSDRNNKRKHFKAPKSSLKNNSVVTKQSARVNPRSRRESASVNEVSFDPHDANGLIDEVLLVDVGHYYEIMDSSNEMGVTNEINFEIASPKHISSRHRKSMSRASKARARRASMVEAQAEGLRQTKSGLFNEDLMEDVEALLIDMGDGEEYGFLFGDNI